MAGSEVSLFTRDAVTLIHGASGGVPRAINDVCDGALLLARLEGLASVDGPLMRRVLSTTPTAPDTTAELPPTR